MRAFDLSGVTGCGASLTQAGTEDDFGPILTGMQPDHEVAVIGAGFSGIGTAIKLDEAGIRDWVMLEEGDGVGGAWHWNTYPGIGVDIPLVQLPVLL